MADLQVLSITRRLLGSMGCPSKDVVMIQVIIEYARMHCADCAAMWPQEPLPDVMYLHCSTAKLLQGIT